MCAYIKLQYMAPTETYDDPFIASVAVIVTET